MLRKTPAANALAVLFKNDDFLRALYKLQN